MRSFILFTTHKCHSCDQMKEEMDRVCGTYGGQERCIHDFDFGRET
jgi:hypothetical protein